MRIGNYSLANALIVAPMAGVTDRPFRQLCRKLGASLAVSEMVASNRALRDTPQSRRRRDHGGETEPRSVQIVGADPAQMADAARFNVDCGAQIIDINMGCPAKKVCNTHAGSALLADEFLVARILAATRLPSTLAGVSPRVRDYGRKRPFRSNWMFWRRRRPRSVSSFNSYKCVRTVPAVPSDKRSQVRSMLPCAKSLKTCAHKDPSLLCGCNDHIAGDVARRKCHPVFSLLPLAVRG